MPLSFIAVAKPYVPCGRNGKSISVPFDQRKGCHVGYPFASIEA